MTKDSVLFHLKEALEELKRTILDMEKDTEYSEAEFYVAMQHLYHHINSAWNSRDSGDVEETDELFNERRQFPKDIDMSS